MRKIFYMALILVAMVLFTLAKKGVDVSTKVSKKKFKCMKKKGYRLAIPRAWKSYGAFDKNAKANIKNARAAKMKAHVYMFPCRGKSAKS